LSVAYIGPKSRTERPRKAKIGTEVAHATPGSDTTFKVKRSTGRGGHIVAASAHSLLCVCEHYEVEILWTDFDKKFWVDNLPHREELSIMKRFIVWILVPEE